MARPISDEELQLKRRARRRLIGAIVLVTAVVVALPMVLDSEPKPISGEVTIKIPSPDSGAFTSRVVPVAPGTPQSPPAGKLATEMKAAPPPAPPAEKKAPPAASAEKKAPAAPAPEKKAIAKLTDPAPASAPPARSEPAAPPAPPSPKKAPESAPPVAAGGFVVQVIALADAGRAKQVQAEIAAAGVKAYTEVVKTAKGEVTRVRAGPFPSRASAEKARDQLKTIGLSGNVVPR